MEAPQEGAGRVLGVMLSGVRRALIALVVAVAGYVAWIPAVGDNAHPALATLAAVAFSTAGRRGRGFVVLVVLAVRSPRR